MTEIASICGDVGHALAGPVAVPIAFFVGMLSFFTPCILPLLPGYLSYTSGLSGEDLETGRGRGRILLGTSLFVLGFALVFTALGATASVIGSFLLDRFSVVNRVAGAFVIVMGLAFLSGHAVRRFAAWVEGGRPVLSTLGRAGMRFSGIFMREARLGHRGRAGVAGAMPLGAAFAIGWTPCVGPGLATILTLAGTEGSATRGALLLFSFSMGFGVWFVLGAIAFGRVATASKAIRRHMGALTTIGGVFLLTIGVLLVTNQWARLLAPLRRAALRFTAPC